MVIGFQQEIKNLFLFFQSFFFFFLQQRNLTSRKFIKKKQKITLKILLRQKNFFLESLKNIT